MKELGIDLNSKRSLINEIVKFTENSQIHSKRAEPFHQNQKYLKGYLTCPSKEVKTDAQTNPAPTPRKKAAPRVSDLSLHQANIINNPIRNHSTNNIPSRNIQGRTPKTIAKYDVNGDRDFMYFNIFEYKDKTMNRVGSKQDGKILEKTLRKKNFQLRGYLDGNISESGIKNKLKSYVNKISNEKRDVKVLIIAFMAHGAQDDHIVFSEGNTCKYISLLQPIFECERLQGVPKVIINQFCRGDFNMNLAYTDTNTDGHVSRQQLINGQSDLLQCFATVQGNVAVRQNNGSPFIRELCSFLKGGVNTVTF